MGLILLVLLVVMLFAGLGFVLHVLWFVAVVLAIAWVAGFLVHSAEGSRWYNR